MGMKPITLAILAIAAVALSACENRDIDWSYGMTYARDHDTGCWYIIANHGGVYPRMGANGKQLCEVLQ